MACLFPLFVLPIGLLLLYTDEFSLLSSTSLLIGSLSQEKFKLTAFLFMGLGPVLPFSIILFASVKIDLFDSICFVRDV